MKTKIAGVSVSKETPPTREEVLNLALKGAKYRNYNVPEATEEINKEIDKSGLFKADTAKSASTDKPISGNDPTGDSKSRAKGKTTDKKQVADGKAT